MLGPYHGLKYDISGVLQHILFKRTIYCIGERLATDKI